MNNNGLAGIHYTGKSTVTDQQQSPSNKTLDDIKTEPRHINQQVKRIMAVRKKQKIKVESMQSSSGLQVLT